MYNNVLQKLFFLKNALVEKKQKVCEYIVYLMKNFQIFYLFSVKSIKLTRKLQILFT